MFSFDGEHEILERDVILEDMEEKYHDKYMIVINGYSKDCRLRGDIVAILTPHEYCYLKVPKPWPKEYVVWVGFTVQLQRRGFL
ncbi:MAG: hypothetical protein FWG64_13430 [Firmicutes bacterium]|nr:hypothetical protein [Bacillota bacterium]